MNVELLESVSNGKYSVTEFSNRNDWLEARRLGIGASDASAVLGLSPWMTEVKLWEEKVLAKPSVINKPNTDIERGNLSESHIRCLYAIERNVNVYEGTGLILRSNSEPFMTCTLDAFVIEDGKPIDIEIKSVAFRHGEWDGDRIPNHYFIQCLHQLHVTGWDEARLLVRFARNEEYDGASERIYHIYRADVQSQIDKLVKKERRFWEYNVLKNNKPSVRMPTI